jgi:acetyl esterase/lipase
MIRILLALAAALSMAGAADAKPVEAKIAPQVVTTDQLPPHRAVYPGGVSAYADVVYATINGFRPLTLDVYARPKAGGAKPLVIYVHGGGWTGGTSRNAGAFADFPAVLADLAARGYVVASVNYRLAGEARFPAAIDDVRAAIRFLRAHAADYGIDKDRVAIWGGSAGGQLAALAAAECRAGDGKGESDCVQAAAIWYGVFDFTSLAPPAGAPPPAAAPGRPAGGPVGYLGCAPAACADVAAKASPVTFVDAKDPPFLLVHGDQDRTVPVGQSREMFERLKAAGVKADYKELPGYDHSFIGKTPEATRAGHLQALQATFDFFDATVGRPAR